MSTNHPEPSTECPTPPYLVYFSAEGKLETSTQLSLPCTPDSISETELTLRALKEPQTCGLTALGSVPWLCTSSLWVQPQVGCGKGPGHRTRVSGVTLQPPACFPNRVLSKLETTGLWSLRPPTEQIRGCHFPWVLESWGHTPGSCP